MIEVFNFKKEALASLVDTICNKYDTQLSLQKFRDNALEWKIDEDDLCHDTYWNIRGYFIRNNVFFMGEGDNAKEVKITEELCHNMLYGNIDLVIKAIEEYSNNYYTKPIVEEKSSYGLVLLVFKYVCKFEIEHEDILNAIDESIKYIGDNTVQYYLSVPTKGYRNVIIEVPSGWTEEKLKEYVQDGHYDESIIASEIDIDSLEDYNEEIKIEKI